MSLGTQVGTNKQNIKFANSWTTATPLWKKQSTAMNWEHVPYSPHLLKTDRRKLSKKVNSATEQGHKSRSRQDKTIIIVKVMGMTAHTRAEWLLCASRIQS